MPGGGLGTGFSGELRFLEGLRNLWDYFGHEEGKINKQY
jgi:hypothetical protein